MWPLALRAQPPEADGEQQSVWRRYEIAYRVAARHPESLLAVVWPR
jgi:hypothetical protein